MKGLAREVGLEVIDETEEEAPDELVKDVAANDATGDDLRELVKEAGLEKFDKTKEEAPAELVKDITADHTTDHNLVELAKEDGLVEINETEEEAPDELLMGTATTGQKDVTTDDAAVHDLLLMPTRCPRSAQVTSDQKSQLIASDNSSKFDSLN